MPALDEDNTDAFHQSRTNEGSITSPDPSGKQSTSSSFFRTKMMSNPPPLLQQRQRFHRRQNSSPVVFEAMDVQNLPPTTRQDNSHRRGQSFDQRNLTSRGQYQQPGSTVSITNQGSTIFGQHIPREAQQQHPARPGQTNGPPLTSQCSSFSGQAIDQNSLHDSTTLNTIFQEQANLQAASPLQQYFHNDLYAPRSAGLEGIDQVGEESSHHYFQPRHAGRDSLGGQTMSERSMSQPDLKLYTQQRPVTPAQQMNNAKLPLTPATTPFQRASHQNFISGVAQSSPIKKFTDRPINVPSPLLMQRSTSLDDIFEGHDLGGDIPSPAYTTPLISSNRFETAEMPLPQSLSLQALPMRYTYSNGSQASSEKAASMRSQSFRSGQGDVHTRLFGEIEGAERPVLSTHFALVPSSQPGTSCSSPTKPGLSPRRMSISDLHLEPGVTASIEETNVTLDDIAQYIEGPDLVDNKWICKYEDCNKKFGRKENIKSHVQTHLGDRQFRCDHCQKCFVRGHDLKRHAKIHTGSKPYPCLCGNSFARHDALTRHRQRGNCVGAFEGVVKKVVKKGRPRKHRPDMDDRLDKANRTRRRVEEREHLHHYASSTTDSSVSSFGSPPTDTFEALGVRGGSPFDDASLFDMVAQSMPENNHFPPDLFTFTPPASPGYSTGNKPSPYHRELTPQDMAEVAPEMTNIQTQLLSAISQEAHGPPSLCHSSSSPVPDVLSFDFPCDEPTMDHHSQLNLKETSNNADFDSFLDYGNMGVDTDQDSLFGM